MRLPLRALSDRRLQSLHAAAQASVAAFARATTEHGSLIQSWVGGAELVAFEHYPPGGVVDRRRGAQFFYHCHRADGAEHGHLHLFWHATRSGRRRHWRAKAHWGRSAPSPLLSIGLDARGLPVSIFTVNHWVAGGYWFDAATSLAHVQRFALHEVAGHAAACAWITAFVRLYEPLIARVLQARDRRLARIGPAAAALADRRVEVLSSARLDWAADLSRLEHELLRRGLASENAS
jgi:hypothetical protein